MGMPKSLMGANAADTWTTETRQQGPSSCNRVVAEMRVVPVMRMVSAGLLVIEMF